MVDNFLMELSLNWKMLILDDDFDFLIIKNVESIWKLYESISVGNKGLFNEEGDIFKLRLQSFEDESEKKGVPVLHKQLQMDFIIMGWEKKKSLPRIADPTEEDCSRSFKRLI